MEEGDFLEVVTSEARVACHFFHRGFERCKIVDAHLQALARKFLDTRFIKLSAPVRASPNPRYTGFISYLMLYSKELNLVKIYIQKERQHANHRTPLVRDHARFIKLSAPVRALMLGCAPVCCTSCSDPNGHAMVCILLS